MADDSRLPLEGVRVADFSWVWAGPHSAMYLAMLGADVIRVESSQRIDITRRLAPFADNVPGPNRAGYFNQYNQGKRSITLNLKHSDGIRVARDLVAASDIVTENFNAGVMDKLGLGYEDLKKVKPDIIMISFPAYGVSGPKKHYVAYGMIQVAMTGLAYLTGYPGGGPSEVGLSYADPNTAVHVAFALVCALWHKRRTGEGQYIDMSQWDAGIGLTVEGFMDYVMNGTAPARQGNRDLLEAPQGVFRCSGDDEWVAIACWTDAQWQGLCEAMERSDLTQDERFASAEGRKAHEEQIEAAISHWTSTKASQEAERILQLHSVPSYQVLSNRGLAEDEQLNAWGGFVDLEYPEIGVRRHIGAPWHFSMSNVGVHRRAPLLGEHTDQVLHDVLGYSEERIADLHEKGALM